MKSIYFEQRDGLIYLIQRVWDGVDRPEYNMIEVFSPDQAAALFVAMPSLIDQAREHTKNKEAQRLIDLKAKRDAIDAEILVLENLR